MTKSHPRPVVPTPAAVFLATGLASVVLAASGPAGAYVHTTTPSGHAMAWTSPCVTMDLYVDDPPPNLVKGQFLTAAQAAAATWSRAALACSGVSLTVAPVSGAEADVGYDHVNRVMFRHNDWCKVPREITESCYANDALAITSVFARKDDGVIVDADIELNGVTFAWADTAAGGDAAANAQDVQNTLTHEFGHLIGLDHNCVQRATDRGLALDDQGMEVPLCGGASDAIRESTMFPSTRRGDTTLRTLADDDIKAVCTVYPSTASNACPLATEQDGGGGCAIGGRATTPRDPSGPMGLALVLALVLGRLGRRRR